MILKAKDLAFIKRTAQKIGECSAEDFMQLDIPDDFTPLVAILIENHIELRKFINACRHPHERGDGHGHAACMARTMGACTCGADAWNAKIDALLGKP